MEEFTDEQQEKVDELVGQARKEGRAKGKEQAEQTLQERIDELEQYKAEAEELGGELEGKESTLDDYQSTVEDILDSRVEGLGEEVKDALEDLPLGPLGKLQWLNEHGEELFSGQTPGTPKNEPSRKTPRRERRRRKVTL